METGGYMPHSQGLSNDPYSEPNQPNSCWQNQLAFIKEIDNKIENPGKYGRKEYTGQEWHATNSD